MDLFLTMITIDICMELIKFRMVMITARDMGGVNTGLQLYLQCFISYIE